MKRLLGIVLVLLSVASGEARAQGRLGVLVVVDQLRASDLDLLAPAFGKGGFGGLMDLGAVRYDAVYPYAIPETAPGHATLATGTGPDVHGIGMNDWYEGATHRGAVDDPESRVLGASEGPGRSAKSLRVPTLGDAMKEESGGLSRVVSISLKDRAAILAAGPSADVVAWYDDAQGRFTSSTAFAEKLPAWLDELGASRPKASHAQGKWTPLPPSAALAGLLPKETPGGTPWEGFTPGFPHDLSTVPESSRNAAYRVLPQSIDDELALALAAVDAEKLGGRGVADLLVVSISATDYANHVFGPLSPESVDVLRRLDGSLRTFFAALVKRLGRERLVLAVTSDHGGEVTPELAKQARVPARRVQSEAVRDAVKGVAAARYRGFVAPEIFLDTSGMADAERVTLLESARRAVEGVPGVARVYRTDVFPAAEDDAFAPLFRRSFVPGRGGALMVRLVPNATWSAGTNPLGANHNGPWDADRRVPLFLVGKGVQAGRSLDDVDPRDVAPSMAALLGVARPAASQGHVLPAVRAPAPQR